MKITYYEPREIELDIEEISLLTLEEAEQLPEKIRQYEEYWWLKSAGTKYRTACVRDDGIIYDSGVVVVDETNAVRPVVKICNLDSLKLKIGNRITIYGEEYIYIGNNRVLYNDEVTYNKFDEVSNDYEHSVIKQVVDKWLEERSKQ